MGKRGRGIVRTGARTSDEAQDHVLCRIPRRGQPDRKHGTAGCKDETRTRVSFDVMDISPSGKVWSGRCTHLSAAP